MCCVLVPPERRDTHGGGVRSGCMRTGGALNLGLALLRRSRIWAWRVQRRTASVCPYPYYWNSPDETYNPRMLA